MNKTNTMDRHDIICPYCGYKEEDGWEYKENSNTIECKSCFKDFEYERNITYLTFKIEEEAK